MKQLKLHVTFSSFDDSFQYVSQNNLNNDMSFIRMCIGNKDRQACCVVKLPT